MLKSQRAIIINTLRLKPWGLEPLSLIIIIIITSLKSHSQSVL
jgi:hypothetical protein